ncbi:OmpA family protein [Euryhalocaulis sp.]|uniref:OmpA family protein n=1 Tax=Euryhalocaulis sp. TaxID=2744307 RepID=UPI00257D9305|nr:OmpA family protein [Euryhalocaulis sp.]
MRIILGVIVAMMAALPASAQAVDGASDHPDIGRYSGSKITQFERVEYDAQRMLVDADEETYADVEGEVTRIVYDTPEGASLLQITRSFEQRLEGKDWDILVICADAACGGLGRLRATAWGPLLGASYQVLTARKQTETGETHAQIIAAPNFININIVENAEFENKVVDAAVVQEELAAQGKMAFYDIHFDTDSATLTGDSDETISLIAEVLEADPGLNIVIVGHTDNEGELDYNIELSRARAAAVADRLIESHDVSEARVKSAGVAFLSPVTTNATAEGRALNRRVEIVVR